MAESVIFPTEIPDWTPASDDRLLFSDTSDSWTTKDCQISSLPISEATQTALDWKVDKVTGKGLSTNDYTDADKTKVDIIETTWDWLKALFNDWTYKSPSVWSVSWGDIAWTLSNQTDLQLALNAKEDVSNKSTSTSLGTSDTLYPSQNAVKSYVDTGIWAKQDTLVSGTNIKTVNGSSLLGSGNLEITSWGGGGATPVYLTNLTSTTNPSYKQSSYTPDAAETIVSTVVNNNEVLAQTYIYDWDINLTQINAGTWAFNIYAYVSSAVGVTKLRIEFFKRTAGGTETTLFSVDSWEINNTTRALHQFTTTQWVFSCNATDRLGMKVYVNTTAVINITASIVVWDGNASFFTTPLQLIASQVRNTPSGNISSTDVQGAINELDSEKAPIASPTFTGTVSGISEAMISFTDVITNNASSTKHGYLPKLDNTGTKYLRDDWTWQTISSGWPSKVAQFTTVGTAYAWVVLSEAHNAFTATKLLISLTTLPVGGNFEVNVKKNGTTILSGNLTITTTESASNGKYTVVTGDSGKAVINTTSFSNEDVISIEIIAWSWNTFLGAGVNIILYGTYS